MKKLLSLVTIILISTLVFAQGKLIESLSINSKTLGKQVKYSLYLPEGYENGTRRFPVLYLLHGYTDNETGWLQFGEMNRIADQSISSGDAAPMLIVMADAGVSWYINDHSGKTRFEDFFIMELIPYIDSIYRTRADKQFRAVAGLSMGGYGSLIYAMKHPGLFAACVPLSAAVWTDEQISTMPDQNWDPLLGELYGKDMKGKNRFTDHYRKNSILDIVATGQVEELKKVRYYIDCGDDDFLIKGNMALHAAMIDKKIPHQFRIRDGEHNWTYWRTALPEVLKFVSVSFHR